MQAAATVEPGAAGGAAAMSHRVLELQTRRRELLLQSERLRAELSADQRVLSEAFSGIERTIGIARRIATPALAAVAGAFVLRLLRRRRVQSTAVVASRAGKAAGLARRSIAFLSLARRVLSLVTVVRAVMAARRRAQAEAEF